MIRYEHRDTPPAGPDGMAHRAADPHAGRAGHAGAVGPAAENASSLGPAGPDCLAVCGRALPSGGCGRARRQSASGRHMAPAGCDGPAPRLGECAPIRRPAPRHGCAGGGRHHKNPGGDTAGFHPLAHLLHGPHVGAVPNGHESDLAGLRAPTAPDGVLSSPLFRANWL